ncbi:hypothetical protein [Longimicrobium sp.]|uniref:hypothetical protein n=1 Tax=Longimicrobium sp. TaxID=2029185 RepID=UPI002C7B9BDD|nr:hypothetical protein [Longimicrobium sp.]HSU16511.1 hypothetical protein [Longimicrobium sp.]
MKVSAVRILAALAVAAAAAPAAARAQTDSTGAAPVAAPVASDSISTRPLAVGETVRLVAADRPYAGRLTRITPDTLVIVAPNRIFTLQRAGVTQAERLVNPGSRGHAILRGAGYGALGGAAVGFLASMVFTKDAAGRAFITADGVVLGALVGALTGPRSNHPVWERVDPSYGAQPVALPAP